MEDQSYFPIVIKQAPINIDDEPTNRLINHPDDLPNGVGFVILATNVEVPENAEY